MIGSNENNKSYLSEFIILKTVFVSVLIQKIKRFTLGELPTINFPVRSCESAQKSMKIKLMRRHLTADNVILKKNYFYNGFQEVWSMVP